MLLYLFNWSELRIVKTFSEFSSEIFGSLQKSSKLIENVQITFGTTFQKF